MIMGSPHRSFLPSPCQQSRADKATVETRKPSHRYDLDTWN